MFLKHFLIASCLLLTGAIAKEYYHDAEDWQPYLHRLNAVNINNQKLSNLLGNILNWKFLLPEVQLRKGVVYTGANYRLRRVVKNLMMGKTVKIAVIGGSISW